MSSFDSQEYPNNTLEQDGELLQEEDSQAAIKGVGQFAVKSCEQLAREDKKNNKEPTEIDPPPPEPPAPKNELRVIGVQELLDMELPEREDVLAPWLPTQGLAMMYAPRGTGKTWASIGIACAVASGGQFLRWEAPEPRGVLFIDGEMPLRTIQERFAIVIASCDKEITAPLRILTPDTQGTGYVPDLSTLEGQAEVEQLLDGIDLIIVDNLSCLVRTGKENEGESWLPMQTWALKQRTQGRSVLMMHHTNKGGAQRGTSRREDVLDTSIMLQHPPDYNPEDGAVFEVHFKKSRGIFGPDVAPFVAALGSEWTTKLLEQSTHEKVIELTKAGLNQKDIADELGVNKSNVSRHVKKATTDGLLP